MMRRIMHLPLAKLLTNKLFKIQNGKLPVICVFGHDDLELLTPIDEGYEEKRLDCRCYPSDSNLEQVLVQDRPHVIITIGNQPSFPNLVSAPFEIRKRWLHYDSLPDPTQLGLDAYSCYLMVIMAGALRIFFREMLHAVSLQERPVSSRIYFDSSNEAWEPNLCFFLHLSDFTGWIP